jgi:hypothetical protein
VVLVVVDKENLVSDMSLEKAGLVDWAGGQLTQWDIKVERS